MNTHATAGSHTPDFGLKQFNGLARIRCSDAYLPRYAKIPSNTWTAAKLRKSISTDWLIAVAHWSITCTVITVGKITAIFRNSLPLTHALMLVWRFWRRIMQHCIRFLIVSFRPPTVSFKHHSLMKLRQEMKPASCTQFLKP